MSRRTLPAVLLLALAGCSFQGSVTATGDSSGAHGGAPAGSGSSQARSGTGTPPRSGAAATSSAAPSGSGTAPPASPSGSATAGATVGRCHTAQLSATLTAGSPGAGQRYATLVLENTGRGTCTVHGYGGIQLVSVTGA